MRVLITGAGGQVGRSLLASTGRLLEVTALGRQELDIADERAVRQAVGAARARLILNCAAHTDVDGAESEPEAAFAANASGARNLALAARQVGARLVHLSTDVVFDGEKSEPYGPGDATRPLSVYGRSKLAGEREVLEICGRAAVVLRVSRVYSRFGHSFVRTMLGLMRQGTAIRVVDDQVGSFTWATGLAEAIWEIASRPRIRGVLHWCDAGAASWHEFAGAIQETALELGLLSSGVPIAAVPTEGYPLPAARPAFSALDASDAVGLLDTPQLPWRTALRCMLEGATRDRHG